MSLPTRTARTHSPFDTIQKDFDTMLTRVFTPAVAGGRLAPYFAAPSYGVDVREDADHLYVEVDLPGFKKDEVEITVEDRVLTLTAERKPAPAVEGTPAVEWLLNERRQTRFSRTFKLPQTVTEQAVRATLADGVLSVTLDKREESKPRKVVVQ